MIWDHKSQDIINQEAKYLANTYKPLPVVLTQGEGVWLWDVAGKKYLDMMSAYSANSHGHCHPRLLEAMYQQSQRLSLASRAFHSDRLAPLVEKLCQLTGMHMLIPMNTGAEAVEAGIKSARIWGYKVKGIEHDKAEIIVADNNFHGRTTTIVGFSSEFVSRDGFGPFSNVFPNVPFGNAEAIEAAITPNTCAVLIEPIQGEAGILMPPDGYLKQVQQICQKHNVLFLLDEIQSGLGRTGKMFAFEHEDARPDGIMLGKALGGGLYPVSMFLAREGILELFRPGSHGSTFGGNPLGATIALKALEIMEDEKLVENSHVLGKYLLEQLEKCRTPAVQNIRGRGLWIGIDFDPDKVHARDVAMSLLELGVLTKETHEKTLRLAPPLTITKEEVDWGLEQVARCFKEL